MNLWTVKDAEWVKITDCDGVTHIGWIQVIDDGAEIAEIGGSPEDVIWIIGIDGQYLHFSESEVKEVEALDSKPDDWPDDWPNTKNTRTLAEKMATEVNIAAS